MNRPFKRVLTERMVQTLLNFLPCYESCVAYTTTRRGCCCSSCLLLLLQTFYNDDPNADRFRQVKGQINEVKGIIIQDIGTYTHVPRASTNSEVTLPSSLSFMAPTQRKC